MLSRQTFQSPENRIKRGVSAAALFAIPLGFIYLADSIMSYIFPIYVEEAAKSNLLLGIIMAFSSFVGIICDFTVPQLFRRKTWRFKLFLACILAILFPLSMSAGKFYYNFGNQQAALGFFLVGAAVWGIYFEFLLFSQQEFILCEDEKSQYTQDWGKIFSVRQLAILTGPILGTLLMSLTLFMSSSIIVSIQLTALLLVLAVVFVLKDKHNHDSFEPKKKFPGIFKEFEYWITIGKHIYPLMITSMLVIFVQACFWTIGGLLGRSLFPHDSEIEWVVLGAYLLPTTLGSIILSKSKITEGKKKMTNISIILGGFLLGLIYFIRNPYLVVATIFMSSFVFSFAEPLNESVYSDLLDRLGINRNHLLGLSKSMGSFAYIVGPLIIGYMADAFDYVAALAIFGGIVAIVGLVLLVVTPRKIRLPQKELSEI